MIGKKFNRLQVLSLSETRGKHRYWLCKCECGTEKVVCETNLKSGHTKSCGCLNKELSTARNTSHGMSKTRTYQIWKGMRKRCSNPNDTCYRLYGAIGIKVCKRWEKFEHFYSDMGECPPGLSIDRINNMGDYKPSNCRWATVKQQLNNTSRNQMITHNNETLTLSQWAERSKVSYQTFWQRLNRLNWPIEKALEDP